MNIDDITRLREEATAHVERLRAEAERVFMEPELERQELAEYQSMTPEQHGVLLQARGEKEYREYAIEMERLRERWKDGNLLAG